MDTGINSHRYAEENGKQCCHDGKLERGGKALADQRRDRLLDLIGDAEIETRRASDKARELHMQGVIQAEIFAQLQPVLEAGILADHLVDRVTYEAEEKERQCRY